MNRRYAPWLWLTVLSLLLPATATPAWAANPATLQLQAPASAALGDEVTVTAALTSGEGTPIPRAAVVLWSPASFLSTGGAVRLGSAVTDARGKAAFRYQARSSGPVTLNASFAGDGRYDAAQASAVMTVQGTEQLYQEAPPVYVPGVSTWFLVGLLGIVWSIYLTVMVVLTLIAREGAKAPSGAGGRHE